MDKKLPKHLRGLPPLAGRMVKTGIKLRVINKDTGKSVNYGIQLNNTTLEIEALPNLIVTIEPKKA